MYFYISTIHASVMLYFVSALLLFLQRNNGERSRIILAVFQLMSVVNYVLREIAIYSGDMPVSVMTVPMLLLGVFMVITYMIYPIEVVSPGWITFKRVVLGYVPVLVLYLFYRLTLLLGVEYVSYSSILDMLPHIGDFDVLFRLFLCLLIFFPPFLLYWVPFTKRYNNTDRDWMRKYIIIALIKSSSYTLVLMFESLSVYILYYYISTATSMYLTYMELFVRIIPRRSSESCSTVELEPIILFDEHADEHSKPHQALYHRLDEYITVNESWRDPECSFLHLVKVLNTNRTNLWQAIVDEGEISYSHFIAKRRINEYIKIIRSNPTCGYMNTFYEVGFRSKSTALRNFKMITGTTPTEYFNRRERADRNT